MDSVEIRSAASELSAEEVATALAKAAETAPTSEEEAREQLAAQATKTEGEQPQRPAWLPEKFKSEEDFATAYAELEKKLGAPKAEETPKVEEKPETEGEKPKVETEGEKPEPSKVMSDLSSRFSENGAFTDEDYALAEKTFGVDRTVVDQFAAGQKALADAAEARITDAAGGKESMQRMFAWASTSLTNAEIDQFNKSFENSDVNAAVIAMEQFKSKYEAANGRDPKLLSGKPAGVASDMFRSWAEVTEAMNDPRYGKDPAYSNDVQAKLIRSKI